MLVCAFATGQPAAAAAVAKRAALVIDANTGTVLHAQAAEEPRYPASLTKMMTLYLAFEQLEQGKLSAGTKITVSEAAAAASPSKLGLKAGEEIAVMDAIKALVTKSANDMAVAIAERIGGSEEAFAKLMTAKARALGMKGTTFRNASGLPDPGQITTARDMITLALRLQDDFPKHYPLFAMRQFQYRGATHRNHNTMLLSFQGTDGIKTGYTRASGFNLVSSVRREGKHLVAAVFGGESAAGRNAEMRMLLTRALPRASSVRTRKAAPPPALVAAPKPASPPKKPAVVVQKPAEPAPKAAPAVALKPTVAAEAPAAAPAAEEDAREGATSQREGGGRPLQIAKVRAVPVVTRRARPGARAPDTETSDPDSRSGVPHLRPAADVAPAEPAAPRGGAQPSTLQRQAENLERGLPPVSSPKVPGAAVAAPAVPPPPVAARPKAVADASGARLRLNGPAAAQPAGNGTGVHIQVGAFPSAAEAERQIERARKLAPAQLEGRPGLTLPVQKAGKTMYRARFGGLDSATAAQSCLELRRAAVDCLVTKAD